MRWKGRVEAWGLWFPPGKGTPDRLLAIWAEGVRLWTLRGGTLAVFVEQRPLRAERGVALVICSLGGGWSSGPGARPKADEIVLHWAGEVTYHALSQLTPADLSTLWDSSGLRYLEGRAPTAWPGGTPTLVARENSQVRDILTVPPAAPEQKDWLRRQRKAKPERTRGNPLLGLFDLLKSQWDNRENQRYIEQMMGFFEKENWSQALRHAIPLSQENRPALSEVPASLRARERLEYTTPGPAASRIEAGQDAFAMLRATYRRAYSELLKLGRVEEAAFVLGELLESSHEAVELLAEHGLYKQAARLATVKGLPGSRQVQLWFLAGQVEAALHLARMHFAHAEALLALERVRPDLVLSFRQAWAEDLARAERLGEALAVGWPARESIPEYEDWMKQALEREDLAACQALALAASDDTLTGRFDIAQRLNDWFADSDLMTLQRRRAVLELLTQTPIRSSHPALRKWANRTARAVMRSASSPFALGDSKVLRGLAALSGDPWLQEDAVYSLPRFSGRLDRWEHTIERRGQLRIYDTGVLADGRTLVALGQAGLIVLSARGAVAQSFAEPVYGLVRPLEGETYLTVSPGRTGTFRENRLSPSIPTALDGFAENHDGYHWVVWHDLSLYQIDLKALFSDRRWQALQQRKFSAPVVRAAVDSQHASILVDRDVHQLRFPYLHTATRSPCRGAEQHLLLTPTKGYGLTQRNDRLYFKDVALVCQQEIVGVEYRPPFGVATSRDSQGLTLCFFELKAPKKQFVLRLPGASWARTRTFARQTAICDDCGRLLMVDVQAQAWLGKFFL